MRCQLALLVGSLVALGASLQLNNSVIHIIAKHAPPFQYRNTTAGEHQGLTLDILTTMQARAAKSGVHFNYTYTMAEDLLSYDDVIDVALDPATAIDTVMADHFITSSRLKRDAFFTAPYGIDEVVLVKSTRYARTQIQTLDEAASSGWPICVRPDTFYGTYMMSTNPSLTAQNLWRYVYSNTELFSKIEDTTCEGGIINSKSHQYHNAKNDLFSIVGEALYVSHLGFVTRWPQLSHELSKWIAELNDDGTMRELFNLHLVTNALVTEQPKVDARKRYKYYVRMAGYPPYIIPRLGQSGNQRFTGMIPEMFMKMAADLDFEYELMPPSGGAAACASPLSSVANCSDALMGFGQASRDVNAAGVVGDIFAGPFYVTESRISTFTMTVPFQNVAAKLLVLQQTGGVERDPWMVMSPFSPRLWLVILLTVFVGAFWFWFLESDSQGNNPDIVGHHGRSLRGLRVNVGEQMWLTFMTFFAMNAHTPKTAAGKLFSIAFVAYAVMVLSTYTANLATILVDASKTRSQIVTLDSINAAGETVCVAAGSADADYIKALTQVDHPEIKIAHYAEIGPMVADLRSGTCKAILTDEWTNKDLVGTECRHATSRFMQGPEDFFPTGFAFGVARNAKGNLAEELSKVIMQMKSNDGSALSITSLEKAYFTSCAVSTCTGADCNTLDVQHFETVLFGLAAVMAFGYGLKEWLWLYTAAYVKYRVDQLQTPGSILNRRAKMAATLAGMESDGALFSLSEQEKKPADQNSSSRPTINRTKSISWKSFWFLCDKDDNSTPSTDFMASCISIVFEEFHGTKIFPETLAAIMCRVDMDDNGEVDQTNFTEAIPVLANLFSNEYHQLIKAQPSTKKGDMHVIGAHGVLNHSSSAVQMVLTSVHRFMCGALARYVVPLVEHYGTEKQDKQALRQQFLFETSANKDAFDEAFDQVRQNQRADRKQMIEHFVVGGLPSSRKKESARAIVPDSQPSADGGAPSSSLRS
jgi:ABC-type amino acid transport substrate-binding protein